MLRRCLPIGISAPAESRRFGQRAAERGLLSLLVSVMLCEQCRGARYYYKSTEPEDFLIGAVFPVHRPPYTQEQMTRSCGSIWETSGIQRIEAVLQAIDDINCRDDVLPNSTLGIQVRDNCFYAPIALQEVSHLIQLSAWARTEYREVPFPYGVGRYRDGVEGEGRCEGLRANRNLVAMVGPLVQGGGQEVHSLLSLFKIPLIGYSFAGQQPDLSELLGYFVSVAPTSKPPLARAMADLMAYFQWTYVSVVYTNDGSTTSLLAEFTLVSRNKNICISQWLALSPSADASEYVEAVANLGIAESAKVVVCFCSSLTLLELFTAIRATDTVDNFTLVASDAWTTDETLLEGIVQQAVGGLAFRTHVRQDEEFKAYYTQLKPGNNDRNPWFNQFWEQKFNCTLQPLNETAAQTKRQCTGNESLSQDYEQDTLIEGVQSAIYLVARALHNMLLDNCPEGAERDCYRHVHVTGDQFLEYLNNASVIYRLGIPELNKTRETTPWYDVVNFRKTKGGGYDVVPVASWYNHKLTLLEPPTWDDDSNVTEVPASECGKPCPAGHIKVHQSLTDVCCWKCVLCAPNQYTLTEYLCVDCKRGTWPNENVTGCEQIPKKYRQWTDAGSIGVMAISALSMTSTLCTITILAWYKDAAVVRASSLELSLILLAGVLASEVGTYAVIAKPTVGSCVFARICPVLGLSMVYAAIFAKIQRFARIMVETERPDFDLGSRFVTTTMELVTTSALVAVQVSVTAMMLIFRRPGTIQVYPAPNRAVLTCDETVVSDFLPLAFDFILIGLCTGYSVKHRNAAAKFNEAKMIGFAMYSNVIIWIAYVAIYVGNEGIRKMSICVAISATSLVVEALLFFPQMFALLAESKTNGRGSFFGCAPTTASNTASIVRDEGHQGPQSANCSVENLAGRKGI
ncbi:metabotropic glutamate receptor 5-like [Haemaphysalis longicornis]